MLAAEGPRGMDSTVSNRRLVACSLLRCNMVVPASIFDRQGRLLVQGGMRLTEDVIESIRSRCGDSFLADPSWPETLDTATPDDLVKSLEQTTPHHNEARSHVRYTWEVPIDLQIIERGHDRQRP